MTDPPETMPRCKADELALVRRLVSDHGFNATAYQILNPGFERWLSPAGDVVVGFVTQAGYRVVAGSPVGPEERLAAAIEGFEAETLALGLATCYFAADQRLARLLARRGPFDRILLGAQPVWHPASWQGIVAHKASLRAQLNRARNKGVRIEHWPVSRAADHPQLQACLSHWLHTRGLPPLHFLVEPETLGRLYDRRVFVALRGVGEARQVVGFLVASPIPARDGWLIEQNIRRPGAPNGTCELLLDSAFKSLEASGATYVTLGLSPLSRRAEIEAPRCHWLLRYTLAWVRAHGRRFYNFEGLDAYKAKFEPEAWEPIYAITGGNRLSLRTLYAIAAAFGRMSPLKLVPLAMLRALRQELRWLFQDTPSTGQGADP